MTPCVPQGSLGPPVVAAPPPDTHLICPPPRPCIVKVSFGPPCAADTPSFKAPIRDARSALAYLSARQENGRIHAGFGQGTPSLLAATTYNDEHADEPMGEHAYPAGRLGVYGGSGSGMGMGASYGGMGTYGTQGGSGASGGMGATALRPRMATIVVGTHLVGRSLVGQHAGDGGGGTSLPQGGFVVHAGGAGPQQAIIPGASSTPTCSCSNHRGSTTRVCPPGWSSVEALERRLECL